MRRLFTALVAVFLLLSLVSPALAAPDVEVHSFGYDQTRKRQAEDFSWALFYDEYKEAGRSHSQPLIIKESDGKAKIVLMAGGNIYCHQFTPGAKELSLAWWVPFDIAPDAKEELVPSRGHTTYDPKERLLISSLANGWLVFQDLDDGNRRPYDAINLQSKGGLVSAPLLMEWQGEKVVVVGSKDGNVYLVTNFEPGKAPDALKIKLTNGEIHSSPGPLPHNEGFIIGTATFPGSVKIVRFQDVLEKGTDGKLRLKPHYDYQAWDNNGKLSSVPASFTMEGDYAYFSDYKGTFYKLNTRTLKPQWINKTTTYSSNTMINRSPALDDKYVYFSVQENGKKGGAGTLVVLDKNTGAEVASLTPDRSRLSSAPSVNNNLVVVGTEEGRLAVYSKDDWKLQVFGKVGTGTDSGQGITLRGLSSEISAGQGLLVFNSEPGTTFFLSTMDTNLFVKEIDLGTDNPEPGQEYTGTVTLGITEKRVPMQLNECQGVVALVEVLVDGQPLPLFDEQNNPANTVRLLPLEQELASLPADPPIIQKEGKVFFTWKAPEKASKITAKINLPTDEEKGAYVQSYPFSETPVKTLITENTYQDNMLEKDIKPVLPDLHVKTLDPGTTQIDQGQKYTGSVTFGFKPGYKNPVTAKLSLTHNGYPVPEVNGRTVTFQPGEEQCLNFNFTGTGKESVLTAKIEPIGIDDAYWPDNEKTAIVQANQIDLAIEIIKKPSGLRMDEKATYVAKVTSKAAQPITTTVRWSSPGNPFKPVVKTITVPAGGSFNDTFSFVMFEMDYGEPLDIVAEVNPNRNQPPNELTWGNNRDEVAATYVTPEKPEPPKEGLGPGHLIPGDWFDLP
jgi:hypothetical protein